MRKKCLVGMTFGMLEVIGEVGKDKNGSYIWRCKCECGNETNVLSGNLIKGHTKSCGCLKEKAGSIAGKKSFKHKCSTKNADLYRLYNVWAHMRERCNNPGASNYKYYGRRGIKVCKEWDDFENFKRWALLNGYDKNAPYGECTIDRINVDGNYEPSNCRWVNAKIQANNRRQQLV